MGETIENNKLITEFMEADTENTLTVGKNCRYKESWDWLIPVLEKIQDVCFEEDGNTGEELNDPEDFYAIRDCIPDITHTYRAIVEFIKNQKQ